MDTFHNAGGRVFRASTATRGGTVIESPLSIPWVVPSAEAWNISEAITPPVVTVNSKGNESVEPGANNETLARTRGLSLALVGLGAYFLYKAFK